MTEQPGATAPTPYDDQHAAPDAEAPATYDAPPTDAPSTDVPAQPRRKHRVLRWIGWSSASLGALALIGLCAYLVDVTSQWSDKVDELTVISTDLGQRVADAESSQADAEARMVAAQTELDNATSRISDLANEEAQANDRESVLIDYVDAMISCAESRQELIDVLTDSRYFFPGKTSLQVEKETTTYCNGVSSDFATFKTEIEQ